MVKISKKIPKILIALLLVFVWVALLAKSFSGLELNSDMAQMVIEANEIISGNIFLEGRYFTGLTFITTDLLFFVIAALFFGMSGKTYILALILMHIVGSAAALLVIHDIVKSGKKFAYIGFLFFAAFPCVDGALYECAHMGCFAWCLFAVYFLNKMKATDKPKVKRASCIAAVIFMTMACTGDLLAYIAIIIPVLAFSAMGLFRWLYEGRKEKPDSFLFVSAACAAGAGILGKFFERLYLLIGGAELNGYIGRRLFLDIDEWQEKWKIFIRGIARLFGADYFGGSVSSFSTLISFAKFLLVIIIVAAGLIYSVKGCVIGKGGYMSTVIGMGFVFISVAMMFTQFNVDINTTRYFCYLPLVVSIWSAEWLSNSNIADKTEIKGIIAVVCCVFIVTGAKGIIEDHRSRWLSLEPYKSEKASLVSRIESLELTNGYAGFWQAGYTTVASEGRIKVCGVSDNGETVSARLWFCNINDYYEYTNFLVCDEEDLTEETARKFFGEPYRVVEAESYKIFIYDYDLSTKLAAVPYKE